MARTYGAYMIQPTKDQLRANIRSLRTERDAGRLEIASLKGKLTAAEQHLDEALRLLGKQKVDASLAERAVGRSAGN